jgi:hypothetical protein
VAVFTLGIGIVAAAVLTPVMSIMVFGVGTMDPIHVRLRNDFAYDICAGRVLHPDAPGDAHRSNGRTSI